MHKPNTAHLTTVSKMERLSIDKIIKVVIYSWVCRTYSNLHFFPPTSEWPHRNGTVEEVYGYKGELASPGFPNSYPNNVQRYWRILGDYYDYVSKVD